MGLSRLALRIATTKALTGATLAGARVFDSSVDPIDLQARERREPFLIVTTDEHKRAVTGRDLRQGDDNCELVIEVAVATLVPVEGSDEAEVVIPHTDAGMELVIDLIQQQIGEALLSGTTVWSRLWQEVAMTVSTVNSRRGASAEQGVRFAARQIIISCDILSDPVRGQTVSGPWERLLAAMEADAELVGLASVLRYAIEGEGVLTEEAFLGSLYGLSAGTVDALGMTPVRTVGGQAVEVEEIVLDETGAAPVVLTEESADEQGV
ncbi:hypothetical protein K2X89_11710 [Myxococcota bacterium]|nr:hypothetical protein [Myxococcota bacterium]